MMEIQTFKSEKRMDNLALKSQQRAFAERLNNSLGRDMKDVLEGRKCVKMPLWNRIKHRIDTWLWNLGLGQETSMN